MPLLSGKKILVTGLLSNRSIAYGIAKARTARHGCPIRRRRMGHRQFDG